MNFLSGWPIFRGYVSFREGIILGGRFKHFLCLTLPGKMIQFDERANIFQGGLVVKNPPMTFAGN